MVKHPNLFEPRMKDYYGHEQKYAKIPWEWWYFDLITDDGYCITNIWMIPVTPPERAPYGCISLEVAEPDNKFTFLQSVFEKNEVSVSYNAIDVKAGSNFIRGNWPKMEIHYETEGATYDLVFEGLTQGVMEPPDGVFIGRDIPPVTEHYMGWVIAMPRAKVTGTLTLAGKIIPVKGLGYHDHQWGDPHLVEGLTMGDGHFFEYWYWGRIHLPDYTLVYWDGQLRAELGSDRFKRLVVIKGDKLIEYLTDGIYMDAPEILKDELTGIDYHRTLVLTINSETISGKLSMKPVMDAGRFLFPPRGGYVRYMCDGQANLEILGKKVDATAKMTNELMFLPILPK